MYDVAVVTSKGIPLMPTSRYRARKLLASGKAQIYKYQPVFTIQLLYRDTGDTQPVELKVDTGYQHIGISVCSEKHEYLHRQYDLLHDKTEKHTACRKYRRTRRNRLRYRKPRWNNRKCLISTDGFAPSIRNKRDRHVALVKDICRVIPVTEAYIEAGNFDTQMLKALEEGKPAPQGTDYQKGEKYGIATLREAVFLRDNYTCSICGKKAIQNGKKVILHVHHIGFWKDPPDRTNRMANLLTVCHQCHTAANHSPSGKLYGLQPKLNQFKGATFMTSVRFSMFRKMKEACSNVRFHMTYGALTKLKRTDLKLTKTHANDAYAMGKFHPKHRGQELHFRKRRRNNRCLEKFYDATYIDCRDGSKKKGAELSCGRTNRRVQRQNPENLRQYRKAKVTKGRRNIRKTRYAIQPETVLKTPYGIRTAKGMVSNGKSVLFQEGKSSSPAKCRILKHAPSWVQII